MVVNSVSEVRSKGARPLGLGIFLLAFWITAQSARAMLQFDVFLGYDGYVPEACWFPVVCEIKNDGPSFTGVVEVAPANYNQGQTRNLAVELPTGTLKRVVIPVFSSARGFNRWDVRLLDERGKTRAEQPNVQARKHIPAEAPVIGALPRTSGGTPNIRPIQAQQSDLQPVSARILPTIFPDNPLVLEGMDSLYLNSEKASELHVNQVKALYAWLHAGGHLIVAVEQPTDINSTPWLKDLFPIELTGMNPMERHTELQDWLRSASVSAQKPRQSETGRFPGSSSPGTQCPTLPLKAKPLAPALPRHREWIGKHPFQHAGR